jgi:hypothetical protein
MSRTAFTLSNGEQTSDISIQNIELNSGLPQDDTQETRQSVPDRFSGRTTGLGGRGGAKNRAHVSQTTRFGAPGD